MTFYERVKRLCELRGISVSKLTDDLGFSKSAGTTWKTSSGSPRPGTIKKIADYFGITIDELKEDGIISNTEKPLTDNEKEMLRLFSKLGIVDQSRVIVYAAELANKQQEDTE